MDVGLAIISTLKQVPWISEISDELQQYFQNKNYGSDIEEFVIGIVCVSPEFERFYSIGKPKYVKGPKEIEGSALPVTLSNSFEYSIKLDFSLVTDNTDEVNKKYLAKCICESLTITDKFQLKIKNFKFEEFKADFKHILSKFTT